MYLGQRRWSVESDDLPTHMVLIAPIDGIGIETLACVQDQHLKKVEVSLGLILLHCGRCRRYEISCCLFAACDGLDVRLLHSRKYAILLFGTQEMKLSTEEVATAPVHLLNTFHVSLA